MPKAKPPSPAPEVGILVSDARWERAVPAIEAGLRRAALAALKAGWPANGAAELSLALVDDAESQRLNHTYRQQDRPTNVLSFPGEAPPAATPGQARPEQVLLGDVVLAFETAAGEATAQGKSLLDHASHLVVHGVLHLLGYDHVEAKAAEEMENLERDVLGHLGIADPYADAPLNEGRG